MAGLASKDITVTEWGAVLSIHSRFDVPVSLVSSSYTVVIFGTSKHADFVYVPDCNLISSSMMTLWKAACHFAEEQAFCRAESRAILLSTQGKYEAIARHF